MPSPSFFYTFACLSGATSVMAGAFGAHALKSSFTAQQMANWQTATSYQLVHSVALLVTSTQPACQAVVAASYAFSAGITLFSGSIYGLCLTKDGNALRKALGPATPIGGFALIGGWIALAISRRAGAGAPRLY
ncbi:hypothetical protein CBS101457_006799 [Exobasidium rhododendri]|nr:hypothetical protein CBS101457_006799 [Exobasidium rhododendri]